MGADGNLGAWTASGDLGGSWTANYGADVGDWSYDVGSTSSGTWTSDNEQGTWYMDIDGMTKHAEYSTDDNSNTNEDT